MEYYAYYSAPHELDDDFTDDFILYMEAYYPGYNRIFHNTKDHSIRMIRNSKKEILHLSEIEKSMILKKVLYGREDEIIRTSLMKKLADRLPTGITVVCNDVMSLGNTPEQIFDIYEYFMHKKIHLAFMSGSAMDTKNVLLLSGTMSQELIKYIKAQINAYYRETERKQNISVRLTDKRRQEKKELL